MEAVRRFLKTTTRDAHQRVDDAFSAFDFSDANGFARFLSAHNAALCEIDRRFEIGTIVDVRAVIRSIEQDLRRLGCEPMNAAQDARARKASLGAAYVLAGSHFGHRILRQRWRRATSKTVLMANAYMRCTVFEKAWPNVLGELSREQLVDWPELARSANEAFGVFESACRRTEGIPFSAMKRPLLPHVVWFARTC